MKPLEGLGILVTRPAQLNSGLAGRIADAGGKAILFPTLEIAEIADKAPLYAIIEQLERFDLAVFISPNAVEKGMALVRARRELPASLKIAAVGQGSAAALAREGVGNVLVAKRGNDSEALLALPELQDMAGRRVAIFRGIGGRETLADELQRRGAEVAYVECYLRRKPDIDPAEIQALGAAGGIDAVTVTSAESARNLRDMLGDSAWPWLKRTPLFALHPRIAAAAGELGWERIHVTGPGDEGLVQGLIEMAQSRETAMNSETTAEPAANPPPQTEAPSAAAPERKPGGLHRANPALAAALLALALAGWQWFDGARQLNALEQTVGKRLGEFDSRDKENAAAAAQSREETKQALAKVTLLEQKLAESQNQQVALEAMYQELSRNRDEWVLAEIEQILLTASQQLQLAGDAKAALVALQTAEGRLQRHDKPQFLSLRKAINQDIQRLQALPLVDAAGYTLKLDGLIAAIDNLPLLIGEEIPPERPPAKARPDDNPWTKLSREIWQDLKQLVSIQNMENPEAPLLPPTQAYFLRENIKLRLLSARLAVLRHDEAGYKADLKASEEWLRRYFDLKAKSVKNALANLKLLSSSPVAIELPDISASLDAAKKFRLTRDRSGR